MMLLFLCVVGFCARKKKKKIIIIISSSWKTGRRVLDPRLAGISYYLFSRTECCGGCGGVWDEAVLCRCMYIVSYVRPFSFFLVASCLQRKTLRFRPRRTRRRVHWYTSSALGQGGNTSTKAQGEKNHHYHV